MFLLGFDIYLKKFCIIYDDGYKFKCNDGIRKILENYLYYWNRETVKLSNADYSKKTADNNIYCMSLEEEGFILFKTRQVQKERFVLNEIYGMYISEEYAETAWLFINKLLVYILSDSFLENEDDMLLKEEKINSIYETEIKKYNNNQVFMKLLNDLELQYTIRNFAYTCWNENTNELKIYKKMEDYIQEDLKIKLENALDTERKKYKNVKDSEAERLEFELPVYSKEGSLKDRFKEKRQIAKMIRNNEITVYIKYKNAPPKQISQLKVGQAIAIKELLTL